MLLKRNHFTFSCIIILLFMSSLDVAAKTTPYVTFSQQIIGFDQYGIKYPAVEIDPANLAGMRTHSYELGQSHTLVVETNIADAEKRGLHEFAATVQRCYKFLEDKTGLNPAENILLYIIEFEKVPAYFTFERSFAEHEVIWGEVRLVLVGKDSLLHGQDAPAAIHELLYDILPHELSHDILGNIANLQHDISNRASYHTRWFTEGVCELLAKEFSRQEAPALWEKYLTQRNVATVLADAMIREKLFQWAQENTNTPTLESDLYGAAMLVVIQWHRTDSINRILNQIQEQEKPLGGDELVTMMESATGLSREEILDQGHLLGKNLLSQAAERLSCTADCNRLL